MQLRTNTNKNTKKTTISLQDEHNVLLITNLQLVSPNTQPAKLLLYIAFFE